MDNELDLCAAAAGLAGPPVECLRPDGAPEAQADDALGSMQREVASWFEPAALDDLLGAATSQTERIARGQLACGHRWRPMLTAVAARCGLQRPAAASLRRAGVAVECLHKASLVHDDIADGDDIRYGRPALHRQHGAAIALNVGDLLIGDGYRLLSEAPWPDATRLEAIQVAAGAHRRLCLGQGSELWALRAGRPTATRQVLDAFAGKTAPAFDLALQLGAVLCRADAATRHSMSRLSEAMGVAYQIRDDLEDLRPQADGDPRRLRASLPLALAMERADGESRRVLESLWHEGRPAPPCRQVREIVAASGAIGEAEKMLATYVEQAHRCLARPELAAIAPLLGGVMMQLAQG